MKDNPDSGQPLQVQRSTSQTETGSGPKASIGSVPQPTPKPGPEQVAPVRDPVLIVVLALTAGWLIYCVLAVRSVESSAAWWGAGAFVAALLALALTGYIIKKPEEPGDYLEIARSLGMWATAKHYRRWLVLGVSLGIDGLMYWLGPASMYSVHMICDGAKAIHFENGAHACDSTVEFKFWSTVRPKADRFACVWDTPSGSITRTANLYLEQQQLRCVPVPSETNRVGEPPSLKSESWPQSNDVTSGTSRGIAGTASEHDKNDTTKPEALTHGKPVDMRAVCETLAQQFRELERQKPKPCITDNYELIDALENCRALERAIDQHLKDTYARMQESKCR